MISRVPGNTRSGFRDRPWFAVVFLATVLAIGLWLPGRISVTSSPSLDHRVFFLTRARPPYELGSYLLFRKKTDHAISDLLLKKLGCGPGDRLTVSNDAYFCNKRFLGRALEQDSMGRRLPHFIFNGTIPADNLFMIGEHERSYDSRYFGFIDAESVLKTAHPLW